jgi:type II secretory ATPase GspE/PulE/Tfp pilus assembly ATPase PilB-like protein
MKIQLSSAFCLHNGVVILQDDPTCSRIGLLDVNDRQLRQRIEKSFPDARIDFESVDQETFSLNLSRYFSQDESEKSPFNPEQKSELFNDSDIDRVEEDAPIVNLLNSIFLEAIARRASDVHIEFEQNCARVRFRIDGALVRILQIPSDRATALSARLKLLANLNVLENRRPQDGRMDIANGGNILDIRVSFTPTIHGESIVLRLLNRGERPLTLDEIGFCEDQLTVVNRLVEVGSGLILVTGPTGSGKTTTLASILSKIRNEDIKIISIEDPVEYRIDGISQIQINEELGLTFDSLLRRVFRQDPDIIMIGEIRDVETAELAVRASLTGHLVFATLHTNSAVEAIVRLRDMGIPPYLLASVLRGVLAQRLVRKFCEPCAGAGCSRCSGTGFFGRTIIAEILPVTDEFSDLISRCGTKQDMVAFLRNRNFISLRDDAKNKIDRHIIPESEAYAELGYEL